MVFSSYQFIFLFLPIVLFVFYSLNAFGLYKLSKISIIIASLIFYYKGSGAFVAFFIGQALFNYFMGSLLVKIDLNKAVRLVILYVSLLTNVGILIYYKYTCFFVDLINQLTHTGISVEKILLPLGISFFTFRIISYIVDSYNNKAKAYTFLEFVFFITYFPPLIIGPIVRHNEIIPQLKDSNMHVFNANNIKKGLFIFSIGLGKKVLMATPLLNYTQTIFSSIETHDPLTLWIGMFANLFAFYFDFSGYTDMAIGVSYLFNIELKENFNSPYKARNLQDYWKRWHITLTRFLTDYVFNYIYKPGSGIVIFCIATIITFFISGLWHGAGINFILWGLVHGFSICIIALVAVNSKKKYIMNKSLARIVTVILLTFLAALYISDEVNQYFELLKTLLDFSYYINLGSKETIEIIKAVYRDNIYTLLLLAVSAYICFFRKNTKELAKESILKNKHIVLAGILFVLSLFFLGRTSDFIYFRF